MSRDGSVDVGQSLRPVIGVAGRLISINAALLCRQIVKIEGIFGCIADAMSLTMSQTIHLAQLSGIDAALMLVGNDKRAVVAIVLGRWLGCGFSG
jgi:hypothetical protein